MRFKIFFDYIKNISLCCKILYKKLHLCIISQLKTKILMTVKYYT